MGWFMKEHDIYIGSMLDELSLRFAPAQGKEGPVGGIGAMAALQKEFKIFKKGRSLATSISVLNLASRNSETKSRWLDLLGNLHKHGSTVAGQNGDVAIVNALIKNLAAKKPMPVYFTSHEMSGAKENEQVRITAKARPVHYLEHDYMVISLPMQSVQAAAKARASKAAKPKAKKK